MTKIFLTTYAVHFEIYHIQVKTAVATAVATFGNNSTIFIPTSGHTGRGQAINLLLSQ